MKRLLTLGLLAALFAAGGAWMLTRPAADTGVSALPGGSAIAQDADVDTSGIVEMTLGEADAPVEVMEYASFTCPHCARFHADQYPQLKEQYIDTGLVRFVYRDVYFDRFGLWAAMVARCEPDRFFPIADVIYATQREWTEGGDPAQIAERLRRIGLTSGIDVETLDACFSDGDKAAALVAWFQENAERDDVTSTPTLFIDGEAHSNMSFEDLAALIDARLEAAGIEPPATE